MRFIICLVLCLIIYGLSGTTSAVQSQSDCENVRGTIEAQVGIFSCHGLASIEGDVFNETGTQIGTTTACLLTLDPRGAATGSLLNRTLGTVMTHNYSIGGLNFSTEDEGVLTEISFGLFRFENRLTIVDGATGTLHAHGLANFSTGEIDLTFNGRICVEQ